MKVDLSKAVDLKELEGLKEKALKAFDTLVNGDGPGNDFLGWINLPENYDKEEYDRIKEAAKKIRDKNDCLLVIGIGGSYLGARAVIEALSPSYDRKKPEILFAGNHLSGIETAELLEYVKDKDFSINVISKSGTTTEPAVAFRLFRDLLVDKYGKEEAKDRIFVTTDKAKGALKTMADQEGFETFVVPDDIGGRFTVLTAVGLLPIAAAGIDLDELMAGAREMRELALKKDFEKNPALSYAASRYLLNQEGKDIEILVAYEPKLAYMQEWWKQLAGESEGKDGKGLFPASVGNTTDLHSLGQWIQEGPRIAFETVIWINEVNKDEKIPADEANLDGLNYLLGKTVHQVNEQAMLGTRLAHIEGNVPNILIRMDDLSARSLGKLIYFFEITIGVTGYMLEVNPFNQPGVELYKSNMFTLLGKPGYEK